MKLSLLLASLFIFTSVITCAQESSHIEQYCDMLVSEAPIGNKVTVEIDFGTPRNIFHDNRLKTEEGKTKKFYTVVDALNHMGKAGWKLVHALPVKPSAGSTEYHYIFKKDFRRDEQANRP